MTDGVGRERAIRALMQEQLVSREMAEYIYAIRIGEIPGDVQYVQDGEVVRGRSPIPLRRDRKAVAKETVPRR